MKSYACRVETLVRECVRKGDGDCRHPFYQCLFDCEVSNVQGEVVRVC